MLSFNGSYHNSIDNKGRFAIPAKFRKQIEDNQIIITRGLDSCLYIYTTSSWKELLEKLAQLPQLNPNARKLRTFIVGNADTVELDKQGRVILNNSFLEFLKVNNAEGRKITVVGDINRIMVWNPIEYQKFMDGIENENSLSNLSQELSFVF